MGWILNSANLTIAIGALCFFSACTPTKNGLLTDFSAKDSCTTNGTNTCVTRSAVESDLYIQPILSTMAIKRGTLVAEIDGNCNSSYYNEHKIVVKVYSGASSSGVLLAENDSYISATNGHVLTEYGKFYPQCLRGKFSFIVPLFNPYNTYEILTTVYVQYYILVNDTTKGEVNSPIGSTTINIFN